MAQHYGKDNKTPKIVYFGVICFFCMDIRDGWQKILRSGVKLMQLFAKFLGRPFRTILPDFLG